MMMDLTNIINDHIEAELDGSAEVTVIENAVVESLKQASEKQKEDLLEVLQLDRPTIAPPSGVREMF